MKGTHLLTLDKTCFDPINCPIKGQFIGSKDNLILFTQSSNALYTTEQYVSTIHFYTLFSSYSIAKSRIYLVVGGDHLDNWSFRLQRNKLFESLKSLFYASKANRYILQNTFKILIPGKDIESVTTLQLHLY